jgi:hypothetical protein
LGLQLGVLDWIVQVDRDQGAGHGGPWLCLICLVSRIIPVRQEMYSTRGFGLLIAASWSETRMSHPRVADFSVSSW